MTLPGLHDRRVHEEHDVLGGIAAMAGLIAAARDSALVFGELPDPTTLIRTGCRQLRALVATSRLPEEISCPSCREHGWAIYQERALELEAAGHAERASSPRGAEATWDLADAFREMARRYSVDPPPRRTRKMASRPEGAHWPENSARSCSRPRAPRPPTQRSGGIPARSRMAAAQTWPAHGAPGRPSSSGRGHDRGRPHRRE
jgi:hypothetical protein